MLFYVITGLINGITSVVLGWFILRRRFHSKISIVFALVCFVMAIWSFGYFFWMMSDSYEMALFWVRVLMAGAIFIPVTFLHFIILFLEIDKFEKWMKWLYLFFFGFLILNFTPWFIKDLEPVSFLTYWPRAGMAFHLFLFFWILIWFLCFGLLCEKMCFNKKADHRKQKQIIVLFIGAIVAVVGGSTNYFLWYDIPIPPVGNILVLVFIFSTFFAIAKYQLMDIKLVLRKSTVFLFSILTVILAGIGIKFAYEAVIGLGIYTGDILMLITAVILYDPLKKRYFILANKYFFSSYYDSRKVISDISENLRKFLDTEKIYDYIYKKLGDAFHFTSFGVLSYDEEKKEYRAMYNRGFDIGNKQLFRGDKILRKKFINRNKPIIVEEVKNMYKGGHVKKLIDYLEKTGVEVIAPLYSQDKNIGLLVFGPKESGDMYNEEDLEVIKIVGAQAAVTLENARLYEKTKDFNVKLRKEVERATKNLKAANRRLRQMDKIKTDFLSIASHQLRTPLTIIKGYISMLLDGTFGKLGKKQQGALEKVFESSDRLIDLVEDLLNISRIESGRMEYNKRLVQMREIVEGVHEELKTAAEKKGLRFFFNEPKKQLPKVNIDPEKIRQVVMNLTDNAIKYTEEGSVSLSLDKTKEGVKFCVEDTGRGIAKDEMGNLFQKFSRNEGSDLVHTEGTGLGLYVAKQIVEGHGGKIRAESKGKGKGSRFIFIMPTSNNSKKK